MIDTSTLGYISLAPDDSLPSISTVIIWPLFLSGLIPNNMTILLLYLY